MTQPSFDPEVVELLRTIVADPRSKLVRMPEGTLGRWVRQPAEAQSPQASDLTKAEKHLVAAYRAEAAAVLLDLSTHKLARPDRLVLMEGRALPDPDRARSRADRLLRSRSAQDGSIPVALLGDLKEATATQLAAASLKLEPNDLTRATLGLAFYMEGQDKTALRLLEQTVASAADATTKSRGLQHVAFIHCQCRHYSQALSDYRASSRASQERWGPLVASLSVAIQLGDQPALREGTLLLDEVEFPHGPFDEIVSSLSLTRKRGVWSPTSKALELLPRLADHRSDAARRIAHAFQD